MLPAHLKRYIVEQDYSRYTPVDQAVWRYIMRQLTEFLSSHAHPAYVEGLRKTGIEVDRIPDISTMSSKLENFGWRAVPVSGFIPPAAFMELQAHGYLPIASDLRSVDHIKYTPAPDIVHEAAGHAPILIDPEFANYLKSYAQVASRAIISLEDMNQYEAIRILSDLKENPESTPDQINAAEQHFAKVSRAITHLSEAALLGRMNWWTAEYGLIGSLENPRIFGAGLLSSVGEAKTCLLPQVKKLPLTIDCLKYAYDITEMQPQLFVAPDFARLGEVLEELAQQMAFRKGGTESLDKAVRAETVNTVQLENGLQISGRLKAYARDGQTAAYLHFDGPCQICVENVELKGHGRATHAQGFGSPLGRLINADKPLADYDKVALDRSGVSLGAHASLKFTTGAVVSGLVSSFTRHPKTNRLLMISFEECTVTRLGETLFQPAWGVFDMAVGEMVTSVFGGPADRLRYGETDDFVATVIPRRAISPMEAYKHELYQSVRDLREKLQTGEGPHGVEASATLEEIFEKVDADFPHDWLLRLEILELSRKLPSHSWLPNLEISLRNLSDSDAEVHARIGDGLRVMK